MFANNFYISEGSQFSDITHELYDSKWEELLFILVNVCENPSEFSKYFNQSLIFELEGKGFSVIKHFVSLIKDIDEDVLTQLIELSFKEELDKYQIFSILFKLLKESEENEVLKSDSEMSSHLSSDSSAQISLLASISSKKNIVFKALLLAFYKSWSKVEIIQVISRLFFIMFLPYAYEDLQCKNDIRAFIDELEESEEIDKILIRAVEIEDKRR